MKKLLIILLFIPALGIAQTSDVVATDTPGKRLQKFGNMYLTGVGITAAGGLIFTATSNETVGEDFTPTLAGFIMAVGFVVQIASFKHVIKAGKLMQDQEKKQVYMEPAKSGVGLAFRF